MLSIPPHSWSTTNQTKSIYSHSQDERRNANRAPCAGGRPPQPPLHCNAINNQERCRLCGSALHPPLLLSIVERGWKQHHQQQTWKHSIRLRTRFDSNLEDTFLGGVGTAAYSGCNNPRPLFPARVFHLHLTAPALAHSKPCQHDTCICVTLYADWVVSQVEGTTNRCRRWCKHAHRRHRAPSSAAMLQAGAQMVNAVRWLGGCGRRAKHKCVNTRV